MSDPVRVSLEKETPRHVAIIMDGNGRWAQRRGLPRLEGHRRGADTVREITTAAREIGLEYLTLYSFSVQNWQRPVDEVKGLMDLLEEYCLAERELLMKHDIRLNLIGRLSKLPTSTRKAFEELREATKDNRSMVLSLAIDYGGREELVEAAKALGAAIAKGELDPEAIDEQLFAAQLGTADIPDPDLMIRTSGEVRLSNFLLWQAAYTELLFTDVLWPDFDPLQFKDCMDDFGMRQRRFGATSEQIEMNEKMGRTKC